MLINSLLSKSQSLFGLFYLKSSVLKNLDSLIFINILLVIFTSAFLPSDNIAYFAIFMIILTIIKVLVKPRERFSLSLGDKFLLLYFIFVLISVAGSSLFTLSLKGFCKTLVYLGFYVSFIQYLKENVSKIKYILLALALVLFLESLVAIKQNFLSVSEISGWQDMSRLNPEQVLTRVYGTLKPYNPNLFGGYLIAALPAMLSFVFIPLLNKHYKTALVGLICFGLSVISVVMTGCRGAYIALFVQLILIFLLTYKFLKP